MPGIDYDGTEISDKQPNASEYRQNIWLFYKHANSYDCRSGSCTPMENFMYQRVFRIHAYFLS